ncbi:MAG: hypothetical protein K9G59_06530 [Caulobacter sp.]|nr:hypothetical protein [Caulobacter sp.]
MKIDFPTLFRHRPFQIAWVWETLCIAVGVYAVLELENVLFFVAAVFVGVIPMVAVILQFAKARAAGIDPSPRSRDIVQ